MNTDWPFFFLFSFFFKRNFNAGSALCEIVTDESTIGRSWFTLGNTLCSMQAASLSESQDRWEVTIERSRFTWKIHSVPSQSASKQRKQQVLKRIGTDESIERSRFTRKIHSVVNQQSSRECERIGTDKLKIERSWFTWKIHSVARQPANKQAESLSESGPMNWRSNGLDLPGKSTL
jgi:hypothetical protein